MDLTGLVSPRSTAPTLLGPCAWRPLAGGVLLTNVTGAWRHLEEEAFRGLVKGELDDALGAELAGTAFVREGLDAAAAAALVGERLAHLRQGPSLHTLLLTATDPDERGDDGAWPAMPLDTAQKAIDIAFMATTDALTFRFLGADLARRRDTLQAAIEYVFDKNKLARKRVRVVVGFDAGAVDDAFVAWAVEADLDLEPRLDGAALLDAGSAASKTIEALHEALAKRWDEPESHHCDGVLAIDDALLGAADAAKAIAGRAQALGLRSVVLEPPPVLDALDGDAATVDEAKLAAFTATLVDALIDAGGPPERAAATLLARVLGREGHTTEALQAPSSEGIGQLAYHWTGDVYTSPLGVTVGLYEDPMFLIGHVGSTGYHDLVSHPTVRTCVMASALEGQPGLAGHAYRPFVGLDPSANYAAQGSLQGRPGDSKHLARAVAQLDQLFTRLVASDDGGDALAGWAGLS